MRLHQIGTMVVTWFAGRSPHELQMPMLEEWGRRVREEQVVVFNEIAIHV